jgi:hypothetical protein
VHGDQATLDRIGYKRVEPIGKRKTFGHVNRGDLPHVWGEFEVNEYPDSWDGQRLRALRRELELTLGEAAICLDIGVAQFSALEYGSATCNWFVVHEVLRLALLEAAVMEDRRGR